MRFAIVSDIHANLQAWNAVCADIARMQIDEVICLGDIVGYGPCPAEVLESVYNRCGYFVLGNHDAAVAEMLDASCFNDQARAIVEWTKHRLNESATFFFQEVPHVIDMEGVLYTHAEILMPERFGYIETTLDALDSFKACTQSLIFIGHTHVPSIYALGPEGVPDFRDPHDFTLEPGHRYIINVGSVGDPRDDSTAACYVVYDDEAQTITYRRIAFDIIGFKEDIRKRHLPVPAEFFRCVRGHSGEKPREIKSEFMPSGPLKLVAPRGRSQAGLFERRDNKVVSRKAEEVHFAREKVDLKKLPLLQICALLSLFTLLGVMGWYLLQPRPPARVDFDVDQQGRGNVQGLSDLQKLRQQNLQPPEPEPGPGPDAPPAPAPEPPAVTHQGPEGVVQPVQAPPDPFERQRPIRNADWPLPWRDLPMKLAANLLGMNLDQVKRDLQSARHSHADINDHPDLLRFVQESERAARMPYEVMESLESKIGRTIELRLVNAEDPVELKPSERRGLRLTAQRKTINAGSETWMRRVVQYRDLQPAEMIARFSEADENLRQIMTGLAYFHTADRERAVESFDRAEGLLADALFVRAGGGK